MRQAGCLLRSVRATYVPSMLGPASSPKTIVDHEVPSCSFQRQQLSNRSNSTTGQVGSTSSWDVGHALPEGDKGETKRPANTPASSLQKETSTRDLFKAKAKEAEYRLFDEGKSDTESRHAGSAMKFEPYDMIRASEGKSVWAFGMKVTVKCSGEKTNGTYTLLEYMLTPGDSIQMHTHSLEDETWYMLDGEMEWTLRNQTYQAKKGCFIHLPSGMPHGFKNKSVHPARMLVCCHPAGIEKYFMEIGVPVDPNPDAIRPSLSMEEAQRATYAGRRYGLNFCELDTS